MNNLWILRLGHGLGVSINVALDPHSIKTNDQGFCQVDMGSIKGSFPWKMQEGTDPDKVKEDLIRQFNHELYEFNKCQTLFLLTHFHEDHYNCVNQLNEMLIQKYYIPLIPKPLFCVKMTEMSIQEYLLGFPTTVELEVFQKIFHHKRGTSLQIRALVQGKTFSFGDSLFHIIWPSLDIVKKCEEKIYSPIKAGRIKLEESEPEEDITCKLSEKACYEYFAAYLKFIQTNSLLKEVYELFGEFYDKFISPFLVNEKQNEDEFIDERVFIDINKKLQGLFQSYRNLFSVDNPVKFEEFIEILWDHSQKDIAIEDIKLGNKVLPKILEDLCLAFYIGDSVLFFGDHKVSHIGEALNYTRTQGKDNSTFNVLIAPHHGTRWHILFENFNFSRVVISNGKHPSISKYNSFSHTKQAFLEKGKDCIQTYNWNQKPTNIFLGKEYSPRVVTRKNENIHKKPKKKNNHQH